MSHLDTTPTTPLDVVSGPSRFPRVGFSSPVQQKQPYSTYTRPVRSDSESSEESNHSVRRARFAEATAVVSPVSGPGEHRSPFADPAPMASISKSEAKPSDFGFGYISDNQPVEQHASVPVHLHPGGQPLKSALKTPGTTRFANPLSPTFREEQMLEKEEESTEKQQAEDLVSQSVE